jgi:hypothetical protein
MPLQIRRGTEAERQLLATVPQEGELIYITNTQQLFVGDGTNLLKDISPITGYTDENAVDAVGSAFTSGTHSGITFTYSTTQDAADRIDATINPTQSLTNLTVTGNTSLGATTIAGTLSVTGKLIADFNGSIHADDSTLLVDGVDGKINLDGTVKGNIIPDVTEAYDIGSNSLKFRDMYLSGTSLWLGAAQLTSTGPVINLPAGSTIDGEVIQAEVSETDAFVRDLQGSVFADDSTLMVDSVAAQIVGNVNNTNTTSEDLNAGVVILQGQGSTGQKAGLKIITDGNADDNYDLITVNCSQNNVTGPALVFERSRGTPASPTSVASGDEIMGMFFFGYDADDASQTAAAIQVTAEGTIASGAVPAKFEIFTTNAGGTATLGLGIDSSQLLTVAANTTTANSGSGTADVSGGVATYLKINIGGTEYAIPAYALVP